MNIHEGKEIIRLFLLSSSAVQCDFVLLFWPLHHSTFPLTFRLGHIHSASGGGQVALPSVVSFSSNPSRGNYN